MWLADLYAETTEQRLGDRKVTPYTGEDVYVNPNKRYPAPIPADASRAAAERAAATYAKQQQFARTHAAADQKYATRRLH